MNGHHTHRHWLQRWHDDDIGWHHGEFNPYLLRFWPQLQVSEIRRVLVPLCGKSCDMVWLAQQGYSVVGVELSPVATAAFFSDQSLEPRRQPLGPFEQWQAGPYEILCGDLFRLQSDQLGQVDALYDRASLVALTPDQRDGYARLLARLLPQGCPLLLVAMEYTQQEMEGPPYSVPQQEIERLFGTDFDYRLLHSGDLLKETDRYGERGLSRMLEQVYLLRRR